MTENLTFCKDGSRSVADKNEVIAENLKSSFEVSGSLLGAVQTNGEWKGNTAKEFEAFFHLVYQLHGWVAGQPVSNKASSCIGDARDYSREMSDAFDSLLSSLDSFGGQSEVYRNLTEIRG